MADIPPTPDPFAAIGGGVYENGGWKPKGMADPTAAASPQPGAAPVAPPPPPGTGGSAPQVQSAYTDVLNNILRGPTPESYGAAAATGPEAAGYRIANRRELDRNVAQNAENSAYSGLSNIAGRERQMRGKAAEGEAQFIGNLTSQRMNDRRQELFQAMQLAASQGDSAAARALQLKLAEMDAALKEKGIASQNALGGADIDLRRQLGLADVDVRNRDLDLRKLLGMSGIGFDYAQLQQRANQDAYQTLLG